MTTAIVEEQDRDIDCPLFRRLQVFLREHFTGADLEALHNARVFMRDYWLTDATRREVER